MMRYQWTDNKYQTIKVTLDDGSEVFVPADPSNRHYAQILEDGITPEEPPPEANPSP